MLINAFKSNNIAEYLTGFIMIEVLLGGLKKISDVKKLFIDTIPFLTSIAGKLIILFNDYLKSYSSNDLILNKMSKEANIM